MRDRDYYTTQITLEIERIETALNTIKRRACCASPNASTETLANWLEYIHSTRLQAEAAAIAKRI